MPERLGQFWEAIPVPIRAALLAAIVALLRIYYDNNEPRTLRRLIEAVLCGAIAFGLAEGLVAASVPTGMSTFAGGFVGLLGADKAREVARRYMQRKLEKESARHDCKDKGGTP